MSTYLERMDKKKKEEEQSSSYSTYLERKEAKNILNGTDTFLQDYSTLVNNHNQTLKDTNNFLKSNELTNDNLHSNIINDSDNYNNLKDKLSKFRNEFVSRYGEKSVSKMEDRLSSLGQSIKSTSKNIETIKNQKSEINAIKAEAEKQSDLLYPGQKTKSDNVSSLEVNEAKQLTGNPMDILFNNTSAKQDEALVKNTRGYANKYANMSYAQLKDSVAKNSNSMSDDEKNFVQKLKTTRLREEGTAEDAKNEYEQLIKNGADENSPEVSHLKEMYQNKYDSEVYNKLSNLSDDDVIKALDNDITVGYGADTKTQNWVTKDHLKYDDVKSYITNYGSLSLLKKYRDYLKENGEYTERNELAHSLLGNTDAFDSTKNKNEDEINQLDDVIKIREQENYIDDTYKELSKSHDFGKYVFFAKGKDLKNITSKEKYDIVVDYLNNKFGGSSDEAKGFKDNTNTYSNYVTAQEDRQKTQEFAKEHPVLGTLQSIVTNLGNSLSLLPLADTVDSVVGIDIDTNDKLHTISRLTNDLREGAKSNLGETGQFIYDTAMSAVDSASYVAMGNALSVAGEAAGIANATNYVPEIVNGLMSNIVAQQAIVEGKEKGYSDTKAVSMGIIQAAIEAITEQYSLDTIIKHPNLLKGALVEGSEEVASNWLNNVVDAVANGDKNRYRQAIDEYRKENPNASDGEALASAICDSFKDDGLSFIAGGLSGAAMSGTQVGINKVKQSSIDRQVRNSNIETLDSIINNNQFKDTEVQHQANYLKDKILNKDEITSYDTIKLQNAHLRTSLREVVPDEVLNNTAAKSDIEVATENGVEKVNSSLGASHPNGILATVEGTDTKAVTNILSSDSGKMILQTDTGDTVNLDDVKFKSLSQKAIFEQASKYDTNGAKQYIISVDNFKGNSKSFNIAFDTLYKAGNTGNTYENVVENKEINKANKILGQQAMNVFNSGLNDYQNAISENQRLTDLTNETLEHFKTMYDVANEGTNKNYVYKDGILTSADIDKPSEQQSNVSETQNDVQEQQNVDAPAREQTSNSINYDNKNKIFNELVTNYAGNESEFTDLYNKAYTAGFRGVSYKSVANNINYANVIRELGSKNVQRIIELGKADSIARVKELAKEETPTQNNKVGGKVIVSDSAKSKVNDTSLYEHIANKISSNIYVDDIKDKRINGYIDKDGIHLNVNHGQEGMLFAVCHEAIHKLKLANIKGYTELKNFVMDVLTDSGVNIDSRTMDVINSYSDTDSLDINNLTEEAEEEIVANAFGSIISNEQAMNKAYALSSDKKSHLVSAIKSIISKLKEFLNKLSNQMPEVKALKDNINVQIKMAEIFAKNVEQSNSNTDSKNKKYLYLGTESKTANISKLNKAKEMEEGGASSESIRKTTGWFKSYDGKWRYEISDKDIQYSRDGKFTNDPQLKRKNELFNKFLMGTITSEEMNEYSNLNSNRAVKPVFLSDFVKHDKLFKSYPQLKEVTLSIDSDMADKEKGFYDNGLKEIHINSKLTGAEAVKTILHEVQHAIQHIEKFATGANGSNENYNRVAGEIEARDSAYRSNFTEEQRKNIRPDIDRTDVAFSNDDISLAKRRNKKGFKKALNEYEWHIFNSSMVDSQARGFRVDDNGILIPDQNYAHNYKLVFYDNFEDGPQIQEVYKLENYDYNMHGDNLNISKYLIDIYYGKSGINNELRRKILYNYLQVSGTILRRFNVRTGRWNLVNSGENRRSIRTSESEFERRKNDESTKGNKEKGSDSL